MAAAVERYDKSALIHFSEVWTGLRDSVSLKTRGIRLRLKWRWRCGLAIDDNKITNNTTLVALSRHWVGYQETVRMSVDISVIIIDPEI